MPEGQQITQKHLGEALLAACDKRDLQCVNYLLSGFGTIHQDDLGNAVKVASSNNFDVGLHYVLSEDRQITCEDAGMALHLACLNDHDKCLNVILSQCFDMIKEDDLAACIELAFRNGSYKCMEILLEKVLISQNDFRSAIEIARQKGCFTPKICTLAITYASDCGYKDSLIYLLSLIKVDQGIVRMAVKMACSNGHLECIELLLSQNIPLDDRDLNGLIRNAIINNQLNCLKYFVSIQKGLTEKTIHDYIELASLKGCQECLQYLLELTDIPYELFRNALLSSVGNGSLECIELLLMKKSMDDETKNKVVELAAAKGKEHCLDYFMSRSSIAKETLEKSVIAAAQANRANCLQYLLQRSVGEADTLGKALCAALDLRCIECVEILLEKRAQLSTEYRGNAVICAAKHGQLEYIKTLFSTTNPSVYIDQIESAVQAAYQIGKSEECAKFILQRFKKYIRGELYDSLLQLAVKNNDRQFLRYVLLCNPSIISVGAINKALTLAVEQKSIDCIVVILGQFENLKIPNKQLMNLLSKCFTINIFTGEWYFIGDGFLTSNTSTANEVLQQALIYSSKWGYLNCVKDILHKMGTISDGNLSRAVYAASMNGQFYCLQFLLSEKRELTPDQLGVALRNACKGGSVQCVDFLFKGRSINKVDVGIALVTALEFGKNDCIEYLIRDDVILKDNAILTRLVRIATKNRSIDFMHLLLSKNLRVPAADLGYCIKYAAEKGFYELLPLIANIGTIHEQDLALALIAAAKKGCVDSVKFLVNWHPISIDHIGLAVRFAAEKGHVDCVRELLLNNRHISNMHLVAAVELANSHGSVGCLRELLSNGRMISQDHQWSFLKTAIQKNHVACVWVLLKSQQVRQEYLVDLIVMATDSSRHACLRALQSQLIKNRAPQRRA